MAYERLFGKILNVSHELLPLDSTFRWTAFRSGWGAAVLSSDGRVMALSDARDYLQNGVTAFVRRDSHSKIFHGGVYDASGLAATTNQAVPDTTPVIVASPLNIEAQWRFFVVNREIVGCSEYRRWGRPSNDEPVPHVAIDLAADLALRWSPSDIYCLDLAVSGDRLGVVEANCFNASRLYSADIERILRTVNGYVLSRLGAFEDRPTRQSSRESR